MLIAYNISYSENAIKNPINFKIQIYTQIYIKPYKIDVIIQKHNDTIVKLSLPAANDSLFKK